MWLLFALIAPLFWAAVHVLDEHCVDNILEKPWFGIITSSAATLVAFLVIPLLLPFIEWQSLGTKWFLYAIVAGVLIQISQSFYFTALSYSEAGIVAAYWNFTPMVLPFASYYLLGNILSITHYIGIAVLIIASTWIYFLDYDFKTRLNTLGLMILATLGQICLYLIMTIVYKEISYLIAIYGMITGIILSGLSPLIVPKIRASVLTNLPKLKSNFWFFVYIEVANLIALGSAQLAIKLGDASLVAAVETTIPAFTFLLSLGFKAKMKIEQIITIENLSQKMIVIILMVIGVWLVS
ncbi:MAG: EamA family transporter [Candidatus Peribacteraceae bacterium]|nr:EamA family transporter [Candidatus Peribacteraceae bacterium]